MTTKYTPGPWEWVKQYDTILSTHPDYCQSMIAKLATGENRSEEDANARLIAAAPELLAFVEMIANGGLDSLIEGESHATIEEEARALLAKATGGNQ